MKKRSNRKMMTADLPDGRNLVAKHMEKFNRPSTFVDRKKELKKNGRYKEDGTRKNDYVNYK